MYPSNADSMKWDRLRMFQNTSDSARLLLWKGTQGKKVRFLSLRGIISPVGSRLKTSFINLFDWNWSLINLNHELNCGAGLCPESCLTGEDFFFVFETDLSLKRSIILLNYLIFGLTFLPFILERVKMVIDWFDPQENICLFRGNPGTKNPKVPQKPS